MPDIDPSAPSVRAALQRLIASGANETALEDAWNNAHLYGKAFVSITPSGHIESIPPSTITINVRPKNETPSWKDPIDELIALVEAETGTNDICASEPESEPVALTQSGPSAMTFGHIRRARAKYSAEQIETKAKRMDAAKEIEQALGVLTFACIGQFIDDDGGPTGGVYTPSFSAVKQAFNALDKAGNNIRAGLLSSNGKPFAHVQRERKAEHQEKAATAPALTGANLLEIARRMLNVDKEQLEAAGILEPDARGGSSWTRFNDDPLMFICKLPDARRDLLAAMVSANLT